MNKPQYLFSVVLFLMVGRNPLSTQVSEGGSSIYMGFLLNPITATGAQSHHWCHL